MSIWGGLFRNPFRAEAETSSRPPDDDFWYQSVSLGRSDLVKLAAVGACIRILSETIASLPCHVFKRLTDDGRERAPNHPAYYLVHDSPHEKFTAFEFFEWVIAQMMTYGAFLGKVNTNVSNDVSEIEPLDWGGVTITVDQQTGVRVWRYAKGTRTEGLLDSEVLFIPGPGSKPNATSNADVVSLIDQHSEAIGLSATAQNYVKNYFSKGALGPVFCTFPQALSEKSKSEWLKWFKRNFSGASNSGSIPILDNGAKLESLKIEHDKMQLNELRRFGIEEIGRVFGVPLHLIQDLMRATNNNIEHQDIGFVKYKARPLAKRIEARLNMALFGPREGQRFYAEFDFEGLLRGDSAAQAALLAAEMNNAGITPNEYRRIRNRSGYGPAGDRLYLQGAMVPIEMAGQQQAEKQAAAEAIDFDELTGVRQ